MVTMVNEKLIREIFPNREVSSAVKTYCGSELRPSYDVTKRYIRLDTIAAVTFVGVLVLKDGSDEFDVQTCISRRVEEKNLAPNSINLEMKRIFQEFSVDFKNFVNEGNNVPIMTEQWEKVSLLLV